MQKHGRQGVRIRSFAGASLVVALAFVTGCAQFGRLQAMRSFKEANQAYGIGDYKKAASLYEEAVKADPNLNYAYFFLGNSYDNMFSADRRGEPENDAYLDKAVSNYKLCAQRLLTSTNDQEKIYGRRSLEYLVVVYGADRLNAPDQAEPVVQEMIRMDPSEPTNYIALAKIYEDAGA